MTGISCEDQLHQPMQGFVEKGEDMPKILNLP